MSTSTETYRELKILNENNKLQCDYFIQITLAPPPADFNKQGIYRAAFIEADFEKVFVIPNGEESVYAKLLTFTRVRFDRLHDTDTLLASGKTAIEFQLEFLKRYPDTMIDTEMAIYCYQKVKA